ncbi:hypothetical protein [Maribacter sp. 2307UL18-2]|uniref:hypothetical protein n=1 Tax=Maribacter sp. 2307UL18-2 TaxID=3386274 RepID=UPI0039BC3C2C
MFAILLRFIVPSAALHPNVSHTAVLQEQIKSQAFTVLRTKCNVCHATKKRTDIFTISNMDSLAADIQKQVFVKKKMPKGRKIKLTEKETQNLRHWLDATLSQ